MAGAAIDPVVTGSASLAIVRLGSGAKACLVTLVTGTDDTVAVDGPEGFWAKTSPRGMEIAEHPPSSGTTTAQIKKAWHPSHRRDCPRGYGRKLISLERTNMVSQLQPRRRLLPLRLEKHEIG